MSNIAGKAYAMNVISPLPWYRALWTKTKIWYLRPIKALFDKTQPGLVTLSLIHYARWIFVSPSQWPRLSKEQPAEDLHYTYELFFSNFNGSWAQYVDSFHMAIPDGLDTLWSGNIRYPKSVPLTPFHDYISFNQVWSNHYYNAYPLAASNDVKGAAKVHEEILALAESVDHLSADEFLNQYQRTVLKLQGDLGRMRPTPIVSLSADAVHQREMEKNATGSECEVVS